MSKITRDELVEEFGLMCSTQTTHVMHRIEQREAELQAQYGELMEAIREQIENTPKYMAQSPNVYEAYYKLCPSPSPADRLDALAIRVHYAGNLRWGTEIDAIAAELREEKS